MTWIARLFGASRANGTVLSTPAAGTVTVEAAPPVLQPAEIDLAFYRWVTGSERPDASASAEKLILDELSRLLKSPEDGASLVPRVAAVIPQLLRSLRDDNITGADLARQVSQDVVLVGEVIREVNSPYYRPAVPVRNLEGAVMLLGQNGLRMLLARVAFRPIISMQAGHFARMVAGQVWTQSEKCALSASLLATRMSASPFEAYLAGMMHNVGLIVAFRLVDHVCTDQALPGSTEFCTSLFRDARLLSARIAALWDFPPEVVSAIEQAALADGPPLAQALGLGDQIAKLRMLVDAGRLDPAIALGMGVAAKDVFEKIETEED